MEEADLLDREVWSGVAQMWYNKATDGSPNVSRMQSPCRACAAERCAVAFLSFKSFEQRYSVLEHTRVNYFPFTSTLKASEIAGQQSLFA
jgi:hypothetical protein